MAYMRRYLEKGYPYFVTTVIHQRQPIFIDEKMCEIMLITVEYLKLLLDYKIFGYCIMPDHIHLIIQPNGKYDLSYIMQMIKGSFSRKVNKLRGSDGRVWQRRFYDEGIRNTSMLMQKIEYVHANPVRKKLVICPEDYKYSSYNCYFGNNSNVLKVDLMSL